MKSLYEDVNSDVSSISRIAFKAFTFVDSEFTSLNFSRFFFLGLVFCRFSVYNENVFVHNTSARRNNLHDNFLPVRVDCIPTILFL